MAFQAYCATVVEYRMYFLQNIVFHFWPQLTFPATLSLRQLNYLLKCVSVLSVAELSIFGIFYQVNSLCHMVK